MTVERSELETCQRLNKKIDHLEAELVSVKTKLEQEVAQKHKLGRCMDVRSVEHSHCTYIYVSLIKYPDRMYSAFRDFFLFTLWLKVKNLILLSLSVIQYLRTRVKRDILANQALGTNKLPQKWQRSPTPRFGPYARRGQTVPPFQLHQEFAK